MYISLTENPIVKIKFLNSHTSNFPGEISLAFNPDNDNNKNELIQRTGNTVRI